MSRALHLSWSKLTPILVEAYTYRIEKSRKYVAAEPQLSSSVIKKRYQVPLSSQSIKRAPTFNTFNKKMDGLKNNENTIFFGNAIC